MKHENSKINRIELLLTLDYLLHHTDEDHPATQVDICEYANKYGLKFDKNAKQGNQVRRQRIGECLKFLNEVADKFTNEIPFVLETTESGKYYIEQRNGLNENQVAKILAAIKNDKYTKDEDVNFLIERVLSAFSTSVENRKIIGSEYKRLIRGVKKYNKETIRKINVIEKAYREGKMVKIRLSVSDFKRKKIVDYYFWYRVYLIKETRNKPCVFMLPIAQINVDDVIGRLISTEDFIYDSIENIDIPNEPDNIILCKDYDEHRDFDELFREKCPKIAKKYISLDDFVEKTIIPKKGKTCIVSFYFKLVFKDILKQSYEEFFSEEFRYQETNLIAGIEKSLKGMTNVLDSFTIVTDEPKKNEIPKYGLVNVSVDNESFKSWLLSDPHGEGKVAIIDMVNVIKPSSINNEIAEYYYKHLVKNSKFLCVEEVDDLINFLIFQWNENKSNQKEPNKEDIVKKLNESLTSKACLHLSGDGYLLSRIVSDWMDDNNDKVNGYHLNAPFMKVFFNDKEIEIDGIKVIGQIFASNVIDGIEAYPNTVIKIVDTQFFDENQKKHMALLEKGYVVDYREKSGYKKLKNLLFICLINDPNNK